MKFKNRGKSQLNKMIERDTGPTCLRPRYYILVYEYVHEWAGLMEKELDKSGSLSWQKMLELSCCTKIKVTDSQFIKAKDILSKVWKHSSMIKNIPEFKTQ